jgi:tetratricopeptide (TPR) repeat protein
MFRIRQFIWLLLILSIISIGYGQNISSEYGQNCSDQKSQINLGENLLQQGKCNESVQAFDLAAKCNLTDYSAWFGKARASFCLGRYNEGIKFCDMAIALNRTNPDAYLAKANAVLVKTNHSQDGLYESLNIYESALMENVSSSELYLEKGLALKDLGKLEEAIDSFQRATAINSSNENAWKELSTLLFELRRYDEALPAINKTLELNESLPKIWFMKGIVLSWNSGESQPEDIKDILEESVESFSRSIELDPSDIGAQFQQGIMYLKLDRSDDARLSFDNITSQDKNNSLAWIKKGDALFNQGKCNESIGAYEFALSLNESSFNALTSSLNKGRIDALIGKGNALLCLNRTTEALESYNAALDIDQSDYIALERIAHLFYLKGDFGQALYLSNTATEGLAPWVDKVLNDDGFAVEKRRFGPIYPASTWVTYGDSLYKTGKPSQAIEQYKKALQIYSRLEIAPGDQSLDPKEINRSIGKALFMIHDYRSAAQYFRDLTNDTEDDVDALFMLGLCMEGLYQNKTAEQIYKDVLRIERLHSGAANQLKDLQFIPHIRLVDHEEGDLDFRSLDILKQTLKEPFKITLENLADVDGVALVSITTDIEDAKSCPVGSFKVDLSGNSGKVVDRQVAISIWCIPECKDASASAIDILKCIKELYTSIPLSYKIS